MSSYSIMPSLMAATEYSPKKQQKINKIMEKERKIEAPAWCEIEKVELVDGVAVVTFRKKTPNFKKGDIVFTSSTASSEIFIFKEISDDGFVQCFCSYDSEDKFINGKKHCIGIIDSSYRFATPEERLKLLNSIDKEGYVWDAENLELRKKERQLPKSWEEFCEMFDVNDAECYIDDFGRICNALNSKIDTSRHPEADKNCLPDIATAEAVLALCQLIQLRNCYNGDWVPDWTNIDEDKYVIDMYKRGIDVAEYSFTTAFLYFKTKDLRDEFLRNFRDLINKLKPLYGIKEGGEE